MATSLKEPSDLDCPICLELFKDPRILPCRHTFCTECLQTYIIAQIRHEICFPCPLCREIIQCNVSDETEEREKTSKINKGKDKDVNFAEMFPLNRDIALTIEQDSNKIKQFCDSCLRVEDSVLGEYWCEQCEDTLCKICKDFHKRNKIIASHTVVALSEKDMRTQVKSVLKLDEYCLEHPSEPLRVFCRDHRKFCCAYCLTIFHRSCKNMKSLDDMWESIDLSALQSEITDHYTKVIRPNMLKLKAEQMDQLSKINTESDKLKKQITEVALNAKRNIDLFHKKLEDDLYGLREGNSTSVKEIVNKVELILKTLDFSCERLNDLKRHCNIKQFFIANEKVKIYLNKHCEDMSKICRAPRDENMSLADVLEIKALCTIKSDKKVSDNTLSTLTSISTALSQLDNDMHLEPAPLAHEIDKSVLKNSTGKEMWCTGGTYLANGSLLLADYHTGNNRLLLFNSALKFVKQYNTTGRPSDVSADRESGRVFIVINRNTVQQCTFKEFLNIINTSTGFIDAWGIAVNATLVVVSCKHYIHIMSHAMHLTRRVLRQGTYSIYSYVSVSSASRCIYYTDTGVKCLNLDTSGDYGVNEGVYISRECDAILKEPSGISVDPRGTVYIGGFHSSSVHQLSSQGKHKWFCLPDCKSKITNPMAIILHPTKKMLIVTSHSENTAFEMISFS